MPHSPIPLLHTQADPQAEQPPQSWQSQLSQGVRTPAQLLGLLDLPLSLLPDAERGHEEFPVRVPLSFVKRMEKGNMNDPLLRQVLPLSQETQETPEGFVLDPLGETQANKTRA